MAKKINDATAEDELDYEQLNCSLVKAKVVFWERLGESVVSLTRLLEIAAKDLENRSK
jgi:hypothetical protein